MGGIAKKLLTQCEDWAKGEGCSEFASDCELKRSCSGYSSGFAGQSDEIIGEWYKTENARLLVVEENDTIVGLCFVMIYGFDSENGTVLWIRELTVDPRYQGYRA